MTAATFASLAFKVLGAWLLASGLIGISNLPQFWEPWFKDSGWRPVLVAALPSLVSLGLGLLAWFSADQLASRVFKTDSATLRLKAEPVFSLSIAIIGLLFVAEAFVSLAHSAALFVESRSSVDTILGPEQIHTQHQQEQIWDVYAKASATAGVVRLLLGIGFLLGPTGLAALLAKVRGEFRSTILEEESESNGDAKGNPEAASNEAMKQTERAEDGPQ